MIRMALHLFGYDLRAFHAGSCAGRVRRGGDLHGHGDYGPATAAKLAGSAPGAGRFDVSPAWHAWVAAGPAVSLLTQVGAQPLHRHALGPP